MSRHAQLPPRCPLQRKTTSPQNYISVSPPSCKSIELHPMQCGYYRSTPQSSYTEEQPSWLNDLLSDSELNQLNETENVESCEPDDGLESGCTYGPNSPRRKNKLGFPGKEIVSAFSEYVMQSPLQQLDDSFGDACEISADDKQMKRHPGQRSRARKLQYIAELERNVDILQNVGSELAVRVASLIQQYAALSMENKTLKQQLLRMKQDKFIVDGEYHSLKKEVETLRTGFTVSSYKNKVHKRSNSAAADFAHSDPIWSMLDMRKLDLN